MKKLNIAIAGYGFGKSVHYEALNESKGLKAYCFYHHNENKKIEIEKETGLKCFSNWDELISDENIDGVIIATPPYVRFELAKKALLNNKHLLLEKPVALNKSQIEELQRISLARNLKVCIDFEYRVVPLFLETKKILDTNKLGEIYLIKLDWLMSSRSDPLRGWNWYSESEKGGGIIGALGTHAFDILHWFFGYSKSVSGKISTSINQRPKGTKMYKVSSEDICLANIEISNYFGKLIPCQVSLSSVSKNGRGFSLEVYASNGSIILKSENQKDYVHGFTLNYSNKKNILSNIYPSKDLIFDKTWTDGRIAPVKRIQELWANSIIQNIPIIPGLSEGLLSQKVCEAIKESSRTGIRAEIN